MSALNSTLRVFGCACVLGLSLQGTATAEEDRLLDCRTTFNPASSARTLADRFGAHHVANAEIPVGEGVVENGTVLFGDSPEERVEILWKDAKGSSLPRMVRIKGNRSQWHTRSGLTLGDDLRSIERRNGRPFRLAGFDRDYGGTQMSWAGGALQAEGSGFCAVRIRLDPEYTLDNAKLRSQVKGDQEFSSRHPAMQALNPHIYETWLEY